MTIVRGRRDTYRFKSLPFDIHPDSAYAPTQQQARAAALQLCARAVDKDEARLLLQMVGLIP